MSTANELMRRALEHLDLAYKHGKDLDKDIRAFLAAEPEAEPVAWMFQHEDTGLIDYVDTQQVEWGFEKNNPRWQKIGPVYLHPPRPEPSRKPMTEEEIYHAFEPDVWAGGYRFFVEGIRFAEKHHGITE